MADITVNMENLTEEERAQLLALIEKANTPKSKVWKPKQDEKFYFIYHDGDITYTTYEHYQGDEQKMAIGNCFRTEEEAQFAVERLKVIQQLKEFANEFDPVKEKAKNYYELCYSFTTTTIKIMDCSGTGYYFNDIYFESEEIAKKAIKEIGEDRIKKYYFCMED